PLPWWARAAMVPVTLYLVVLGCLQMLNPSYLGGSGLGGVIFGAVLFGLGAAGSSVTLTAAHIHRPRTKIRAGYRRSMFGKVIHFIAGNPIMPVVSIAAVVSLVVMVFIAYGQHNKGVEFFVESEPEQAIIYVRARGNLSLIQTDALVKQVEQIALQHPGVENAFAFAGDGGLNANTGGAQPPLDTVGQVQIELVPWENRKDKPELDGNLVLDDLRAALHNIPGIKTEILDLSMGPASAKPVHLRLKGDNWDDLLAATSIVRARFEDTPGLTDVEDTLPLPGIDWQIDVDVEQAGRYGADVATVGGMVQLVTRGLLLDQMRVPSSDEEIDIRVRLPEKDRVLSTLDSLKVRTASGLVPLSNFITRKPVAKLGRITRVDGNRFFDVKAGVDADMINDAGQPMNPTERIELLTQWLKTDKPLPAGIDWEWTGDQEDQTESQAFLSQAFLGALGLMFIILLAQFNSFYNATLVLLAVVLSTTGVLIGMLVMDQTFSIIMTGTGIVALAGIVVNNNIVLIDTYQEFSQYMPRIEAITRTAEARIRPVLLTTVTTMAGLASMMWGLSFDFINGGYSIDSPTALWWKQLATAVVFGLGIATVLTLIFTPSMLALRVWFNTYVAALLRLIAAVSGGSGSRAARDRALNRAARKLAAPELIWDDPTAPATDAPPAASEEQLAALRQSRDDQDRAQTADDKAVRAAE
ncbi:efflux RND transporter permease subunit, partial [Actibacterium sp.]|uniref:efflux RND transporter permease subunit n=1 Tax=Actibacterium sp. TaxID=1872125 RepID=UPI0035644CC8